VNALRLWQNVEHWSGESRWCLACNRWLLGAGVAEGFGLISRLGDGAFWYALILGLAGLGGATGRHAALQMTLTGLSAALLYRVLKRYTRRPRPFRTHREIIAPIAPLDEFSFPSGHTLHAVHFTILAVAHFPVLAPLLVPFALLVAASRVVLGLHYPSDVLAGAAIGAVLATLSLQIG
jgi:undecaprenyl-diphosphatase